jgi:hypothetical protein
MQQIFLLNCLRNEDFSKSIAMKLYASLFIYRLYNFLNILKQATLNSLPFNKGGYFFLILKCNA